MEGTKFVKALCEISGKHYSLEVMDVGGHYEVVDMTELGEDKAKVITSEVRQDFFNARHNLQACHGCGSRRVGGCDCPRRSYACSKSSPYNFQCLYCKQFKIDYSRPASMDLGQYKEGDYITTDQGKKVRIITFSNVEWEKFDNVDIHPDGSHFGEPRVHVFYNERKIEFKGYNISRMDEGVFYRVDSGRGFSIECDVDTSTIKPHPGGYLYVECGIITARIEQKGGTFSIKGEDVASVGSRFKMKLSVDATGHYEIFVNGRLVASKDKPRSDILVKFGFHHKKHNCEKRSDAYLNNIKMELF